MESDILTKIGQEISCTQLKLTKDKKISIWDLPLKLVLLSKHKKKAPTLYILKLLKILNGNFMIYKIMSSLTPVINYGTALSKD